MIGTAPSRTVVLVALVASAAVLSGCLGVGVESADDIVVENDDDTPHEVTLVFDRGRSYDTENGTVTVEADSRKHLDGFIPHSDTNYPFYLHVFVDGTYVNTTAHQWEGDLRLVLDGDEVSANYSAPLPDSEAKRHFGNDSALGTDTADRSTTQ